MEWISHRGLHGAETDGVVENSAKAFDLAVADGFEWLETDLRVSADDVVFLQHDLTLNRSANRPETTERMSWKDINDVTLNDGQRICRMDQFMESYASQKWLLDIKPERGLRTLEVLWESSRALLERRVEEIWFLVWQPEHRRFIRERLPNAQLFAPTLDCYRAGFSALIGAPAFGKIVPGEMYALPPAFFGINVYTDRLLKHYKKREANLIAFLPDTDAHVRQAMQMPFSLLMTNRSKSRFVPPETNSQR